MLHKQTMNRIRMIPTDPDTGPVERADLVPRLVEMLDEPDPRMPVIKKAMKIDHHRSLIDESSCHCSTVASSIVRISSDSS